MSIDFRPIRDILVSELFDGRLKESGIRERRAKNSAVRVLTDGANNLVIYVDDQGRVGTMTNYGFNDSTTILLAIQSAFGVKVVSEHDPQYWGFDSEEEWEAKWPEGFGQLAWPKEETTDGHTGKESAES